MQQYNKLVLIDDDLMLHWAFQAFMKKIKPEVEFITFRGGIEAGEAIDQLDDAVVLLDLNMPAGNGFEFLSEHDDILSEMNTHVYVLSSSVNKQDIRQSMNYKCVRDFLVKPMSFSKIDSLLKPKDI